MKKIPKRLLVRTLLLAVIVCALVRCGRDNKNSSKRLYDFVAYVPLKDEYALVANAITSFIQLSFPNSKIVFEEGLSDRYSFAPFDDWIKRADSKLILQLNFKFDKQDDIHHVTKFLKAQSSLFPFNVSLPSLSDETLYSEYKGEVIFCRSKNLSPDIYAKQLCSYVISKLCSKDLRPQVRRFASLLPASCILELNKNEAEVSKSKTSLTLTSLPLPLKVNEDYPLSRFQELDDALLLNLFSRN